MLQGDEAGFDAQVRTVHNCRVSERLRKLMRHLMYETGVGHALSKTFRISRFHVDGSQFQLRIMGNL